MVTKRAESSVDAEAAAPAGLLTLRHGGLQLEVDPVRGARICTFSLNGLNVLTGPGVDPDNFGSTFWTAPQSDWGWPPIGEIDGGPYAVRADGSGFVCRSAPSERLGIEVIKRFSLEPERDRVRVDYELCNRSAAPVRYAPWEISRVPGGLTFFAGGEGRLPNPPLPEPAVVETEQLVWFEYDRERVDRDQKLFIHSNEGWLAHAIPGLLLLKEFDLVEPEDQAPGEAMVEIFASGTRDYVEIEQQGSYAGIPPGQSRSWTVRWSLHALPLALPLRAGTPELVSLTRRALTR